MSSDRDVEDLLAEYVDRLNAGEPIDRARIRAEHPSRAEELLSLLEDFLDAAEFETRSREATVIGDYTLRRQIGRGGMGVVYEAWQHSMDRVVALKVLPVGVASDDRAFQRFLREAKTAGKLDHPNVVRVHGLGIEEQTPYYAMEYVEGETLAEILARIRVAEPETETPFGPKGQVDYFARLARSFAGVADGLQHAHSKAVVHRDVKPSNLILASGGRLRLLDFGLAHIEGHESLTISGDVLGTPLYMSPEQARRRKIPVDHRTDVYSLGATMYEALCGRPPFRGKDHADTLSQIIERDPVEPRKIDPRVPQDLETIVLKCLRKDVGDRYGTAEALGQDLRRFVRGDVIEARPISGWVRFTSGLRRHRKLAAAVVGVSLILLIVAMVIREHLVELREASTTALIHRERGLNLWRERDLEGALEEFTLAIRRKPDHVLYHNRANVHADLGDLDRALDDYVLAIRSNPGFSREAHIRLMETFVKRDDLVGAPRVLEGLIASKSSGAGAEAFEEERRKSLGLLHHLLAEVLIRLGDPRRSAEAGLRAWEISPEELRNPVVTLSLLRQCVAVAGEDVGTRQASWLDGVEKRVRELESLTDSLIGPAYSTDGEFVPLDLAARANAKLTDSIHFPDIFPKSLGELPRGRSTICGVSFRIENALIQLYGRDIPERPTRVDGIEVNETFSKLHVLHGTGWVLPDGTEIGRYEVLYADGSRIDIPIVYGVDVRNWDWNTVDEEAVTREKRAWVGTNPRGRIARFAHRLYLLTWENPEPAKEVRAIHCVSAETLGAPFCVAMTIEKAASAPAEARAGQ